MWLWDWVCVHLGLCVCLIVCTSCAWPCVTEGIWSSCPCVTRLHVTQVLVMVQTRNWVFAGNGWGCVTAAECRAMRGSIWAVRRLEVFYVRVTVTACL